MRRFAITVLVATVLHAVACILIPPFEFGPSRPAGFFFAFVSGLMVFPIMFAVILLPLRAALRRLLPNHSQRSYAVMAGVVLVLLVVAHILPPQLAGLPVKPYQHNYTYKWAFWLLFALVVDISFFWPFQRITAAR